MIPSWKTGNHAPFTMHEWQTGVIVFVAFVASTYLSAAAFPAPSILFLGAGIALGALALAGAHLWPFIFFASLTSAFLHDLPPAYMLLIPMAHAVQAGTGAFLLRSLQVDPLFRRTRDMGLLIAIVLVISVIVPTVGQAAYALNEFLAGPARVLTPWGSWFIANMFSLMLVAPFIMRWFAKPRFARTVPEAIETVAAFLVLGIINYFLFFTTNNSVAGVSMVYVLLIPLFWIALRLRPRFVTLALLGTAFAAVCSLYVGVNVPAPDLFNARLVQTELFFIILAIIFYVVVALEEDRRVTTNVLKSQLATLGNAVERISSESQAKNDFMAILGHELRNPLTPIKNGIELLKAKNGRPSEEKETIVLMEDRMNVIERLLDDLLDVSRIAERKITIRKEPTSVGTVVSRAMASTGHHFKERHQQLDIDLSNEPMILDADPVRIEQVLSNLLTNASRYTPSGGHIRLIARRTGEQAEIKISDTGIGIEKEMLGFIFEPFRQIGAGDARKKGLGIGLALVKSFVEMHNGSVGVASAGKDKGSTFTITLPLVSAFAHQGAQEEKESAQKNVHATDGPRILIVDDNDAAAWGIGKLLELRGATVAFAYTGNQALERAAEESFDTILLDIGLPDVNGYEVAKTLRARGFRGTLIALTGYSLDEDRVQGSGAGFEHYLVKPVGFVDLKRVIPGIG